MSEEKEMDASNEQAEVSEDALSDGIQQREDSFEDGLFLSPDDSEGEVIDMGDVEGQIEGNPGDARSDLAAENAALREGLEELKAENEEQKNRVLRVAADLENFRRRSQREKDDLRKYGIDRVVTELLPAIDNLERALEHATGEAENSSMTEGVRMVCRQILSALEKHGVQGFASKGEPFDPQRHEALQQVESTELPNNTVVEEYQKGYFLHDRLLRPALVSVAKHVQNVQSSGSVVDQNEEEPSGSADSDSGSEKERAGKGDDVPTS